MEGNPKPKSSENIIEEKKHITSQGSYDFYMYRKGDKAYVLTKAGTRELTDADINDGGANCPNKKTLGLIGDEITSMKNSGVVDVFWVGGNYMSPDGREIGFSSSTGESEAKIIFEQFNLLDKAEREIEHDEYEGKLIEKKRLKTEQEEKENEIILSLIEERRYSDAEVFCKITGHKITDFVKHKIYY
jgi:hypothetical protein